MIRYQRDQDDEPMLSNEENGASGMLVDEYGQPVPSPKAANKLTFEQQKAELKRKIMAQPAKRQKVKKEKKDTVYNPEGKCNQMKKFKKQTLLSIANHDIYFTLISAQQRDTRRDRGQGTAKEARIAVFE